MIQKELSTVIKHHNEHLYKSGSFVVSNKRVSNSKIEVTNKYHQNHLPIPQIKTGFKKLVSKLYVDSLRFDSLTNTVHLRVIHPFEGYTVYVSSFDHAVTNPQEVVSALNVSSIIIPKQDSFESIELPISYNSNMYVYILSDNQVDNQLILIQ